MAKRRMFSPDIVESDAFLDMPLSAQCLYFHFGMDADDDGFVNPKRIMRMLGSQEDDLRILLAKRFVLPFDSGVVVVKHWTINNQIRQDRYKKTMYKNEIALLGLNENGAYTEINKSTKPLTEVINARLTSGKPNGNPVKVRLGKVRLNKTLKSSSNELSSNKSDIQELFDLFTTKFEKEPSKYKLTDKRRRKLNARLKDAGKEMIEQAILRTAESPFHRGDNDRGWTADLDFIIRSYEQVERLSELEVKLSEQQQFEKFKQERGFK